MKNFYRNPKTDDLIIWDSEDNEILILEKIKVIQKFTEDDLFRGSVFKEPHDRNMEVVPYKKDPVFLEAEKRERKRKSKITDAMVEKIMIMKENYTAKQIAKTMGISMASVFNSIKKGKSLETQKFGQIK